MPLLLPTKATISASGSRKMTLWGFRADTKSLLSFGLQRLRGATEKWESRGGKEGWGREEPVKGLDANDDGGKDCSPHINKRCQGTKVFEREELLVCPHL
jgi:hypothetical protein